jgi:hypothetical protein
MLVTHDPERTLGPGRDRIVPLRPIQHLGCLRLRHRRLSARNGAIGAVFVGRPSFMFAILPPTIARFLLGHKPGAVCQTHWAASPVDKHHRIVASLQCERARTFATDRHAQQRARSGYLSTLFRVLVLSECHYHHCQCLTCLNGKVQVQSPCPEFEYAAGRAGLAHCGCF